MILSSVKKTLSFLPSSYRLKTFLMLLGVITNSFLELLGLAAVLPLLASILKEGFIQNNFILSEVYKYFNFQSDKSFILFLSICLVLFMILKNVFGLWFQKKQVQYTWDAYSVVSKSLLASIYSKGFMFFKENNSNEILNNVVNIPNIFSIYLINQMFLFFNELIVLGFVLVSLLVYDFNILILLSVVVLPVFLLFYKLSKNKIARHKEKLNENQPKISKNVFDVVFGYTDVAIGRVFRSFESSYLKLIEKNRNIRVSLSILEQMPNRLIEVAVIISVVIMLLYGVFVLESPTKIVGLLSVFGLAAYRSIPSVNRLMLSLMNIKGFQYAFDVLGEYLPYARNEEVISPIDFKNEIELRNVSFKYSDSINPILNDYSLKIKKGEVIGLVGESGSGKTTLMNILLGFLSPKEGQLLIDNQVISEDNVTAWQGKIGYVNQEVFLLDGTLVSNIAFGIEPHLIDLDKINMVLEKASLKSFVDDLPDGINTNIGERGAKISGGQRQRIGIARALYHDAEVLFFDEATSALDNKTETEVTESIRALDDGELTMVIIAHRESSLKYCNRVTHVKQKDV